MDIQLCRRRKKKKANADGVNVCLSKDNAVTNRKDEIE